MKITRRCNFCKKAIKYCCDFLKENNEWERIGGCEKHKYLAISLQDKVKCKEYYKFKINTFGRSIIFTSNLSP